MTDENLAWMPATEMASLIRQKRLSPVEVMTAVLARIERHNPTVNAFVYQAPEAAMAAARAAEAAVASGAPLGKLHGVPITIKDLVRTKDMPMQSGSQINKGQQPLEDAPVVQRLKAAGAIVLGKTTTPEFGWKGVSQSPLTGITHNPWKHGYNAGASSAGAAAAAASGFGPLHQGGDGAGSIRMPAHFCGVFGLKPTYGRVPYYPVANGDYSAHLGPITRSVADAALMLQVMAGPHPLDHTSCEMPPDDYPAKLGAGIAGKRIAFSPDLGHARVDPEIASLVRTAVGRLQELGARVEQVTPAWAKDGPEIIRCMWSAHVSGLADRLPEWESRMDPGLVACVKDGMKVRMSDYQLMRDRKYAYNAAQNRWFGDWDFLVTPAVSVAAFPADRLQPAHWPQHPWDWIMWAEFSYPFNFSGNPAASIPCGFTADGLPVGLQIVGRRFDDLGVLQAAAAFEAAAPWADKRPPLD
jgi:aspartyl-tRNA(Asn)/glutamyl-tRNA(Gln) amidotransferase subunit A